MRHLHRLLYFGNEDGVGPPIVRASGDARHLTQCDACETREEDLGDFRNGSLVCDVAPLRAFSLARAISQSATANLPLRIIERPCTFPPSLLTDWAGATNLVVES